MITDMLQDFVRLIELVQETRIAQKACPQNDGSEAWMSRTDIEDRLDLMVEAIERKRTSGGDYIAEPDPRYPDVLVGA